MTDEEKIQATMKLKDDGNIRFKEGKFKEAEGLYREAIDHLKAVKNDNADIQNLKKTIYVNIAIACNKTKDYQAAILSCEKSLKIDDKNIKAYSNRATAYQNLKQYDEAINDIKEVIKLNPSDKGPRQTLETLKELRKKQNASEANMFQKAFQAGLYSEKKNPEKKEILPPYDPTNPKVYMDIQIGETKHERLIFELFTKKTPKTAENFRCLCTGEKGEDLFYKGNIFHRIIKGFMAQGGDITKQNGTGGKSIYGHKFDDEGVWIPHDTKGLLSMANAGKNTNGSQFFITFKTTPHLNGKHTVFGRLIKGFSTLSAMENVSTTNDLPDTEVKIIECGQITEEIPESELELNHGPAAEEEDKTDSDVDMEQEGEN